MNDRIEGRELPRKLFNYQLFRKGERIGDDIQEVGRDDGSLTLSLLFWLRLRFFTESAIFIQIFSLPSRVSPPPHNYSVRPWVHR